MWVRFWYAVVCGLVNAAASLALCPSGNGNEPLGKTPEMLRDPLEFLTQRIDAKDLSDLNDEEYMRVLNSFVHVGTTGQTILDVFDVVNKYDNKIGEPVQGYARPHQSRTRSFAYTIAKLQQSVLDTGYTHELVQKHFNNVYSGKGFFNTANFFPGKAVGNLKDHRTLIDASNIEMELTNDYYSIRQFERPAVRPTGCYLPAGGIATVQVPDSLFDGEHKYKIRVGSHPYDLKYKDKFQRLDRVTLEYDILCKSTKIAHPLGGAIYIEVPYKADSGLVNININGCLEAPYFSQTSTSIPNTSNEEFAKQLQQQYVPWADLETDLFMMTIPRSWALMIGEDVASHMKEIQDCMETVWKVLGYSAIYQTNKPIMWIGIDVIIRSFAFIPGYPMSNSQWRAEDVEYIEGRERWMVEGHTRHDSRFDWIPWHELGHWTLDNYKIFSSDLESAVNVLGMAVLSRTYCVDLEEAFRLSISGVPKMTTDIASIQWTTHPFYQEGKIMTINEAGYQHRGHAKYADIVKLFGWDTFDKFRTSFNTKAYKRSDVTVMSETAGADLRPLLVFWGQWIDDDSEQSQTELDERNLRPSAKIQELLQHYKELIPKNNGEFLEFAEEIYGYDSKEYLSARDLNWNEAQYEKAVDRTNQILDFYFSGVSTYAEMKDIPEIQCNYIFQGNGIIEGLGNGIIEGATNDTRVIPDTKVIPDRRGGKNARAKESLRLYESGNRQRGGRYRRGNTEDSQAKESLSSYDSRIRGNLHSAGLKQDSTLISGEHYFSGAKHSGHASRALDALSLLVTVALVFLL